MFERILVAVDGSDNALRAVDVASTIAAKFDAELVVVTVLHPLRHLSKELQALGARLVEGDLLDLTTVQPITVRNDVPAPTKHLCYPLTDVA